VAHYQDTLGKHAPHVHWRDEWTAEVSFRAAGRTFDGSVHVGPEALDLEMDVPLIARPFQRRALALIEREVAKWVGKMKGGAGA